MAEKETQVLFVCTECNSGQSINPYRSQWIQSGHDVVPCKFCGGIAVYVENPEDQGAAITHWNRQRGIGSGGDNGNFPV